MLQNSGISFGTEHAFTYVSAVANIASDLARKQSAAQAVIPGEHCANEKIDLGTSFLFDGNQMELGHLGHNLQDNNEIEPMTQECQILVRSFDLWADNNEDKTCNSYIQIKERKNTK